MLLDIRDIELLHLAGRYRWLPYGQFHGYGLSALDEAVRLLAHGGFVSISRSKEYFRLTPKAFALLDQLGLTYDPSSKRTYSGSSSLRRRLEAARLMITCLRAGIDVTPDEAIQMRSRSSFLPSFALRVGGSNLMNAASCAGFGNWGNVSYLLQYISPQNNGMLLSNELGHLNGLSAMFSQDLNRPKAMIYAGPSYAKVYEQLTTDKPSKRHGKHGFFDYWHIYSRSDMPIHLLACNRMGAIQLAVMSVPDYNQKIARAATGYGHKDDGVVIPEVDGYMDGKPLIIAVDMDVRRVLRICQATKARHCQEVLVAAFPEQIDEVLYAALPQDGSITFLTMELPVLGQAFGKAFSLYTPERSAALGPKGGLVYA